MASDYIAVSLTIEARDTLRRITAAVTGHTGRRVSMSDALHIVERITTAHAADIPAAAAALGIIPTTPGGNPS